MGIPRNGARGYRGSGGVASGSSQFENDHRLKHPWNSGLVAADVRARVGLRSANCLVDCRANAHRLVFVKWPQSRDHSNYTWRFFVEGPTAAFEAGELLFFADLALQRCRDIVSS
jgi:hypothetical protein